MMKGRRKIQRLTGKTEKPKKSERSRSESPAPERPRAQAGSRPKPPAPKKSSTSKKSSPPKKPRAQPQPRAKAPARKTSRSKSGESMLVRGMFQGNARGFGFVRPEAPGDDVFVPARHAAGALDGDRVEVQWHARGRMGKPWGEVTQILTPRRTPVVGKFNGLTVVPRDPRFNAWIKVHWSDAGEAEDGDVVAVEITRRANAAVHGRVIEVLGHGDEPGIESRIALYAHGFNEEFPAEARDEAESAPKSVSAADRAGREDLRSRFIVTIDPERARDFDDAVAVSRLDSGYRLWVAIADVSHYIAPGSALDAEAYARATSVYLPDRAVHMLPEALSAGVCSLKPRVDRLALVVEMDFDAGGQRQAARMYSAVIRSRHRLTYDGVEELAADPARQAADPELWAAIALMRELAELRRKRRRERGAIDLDVPEAEVVLDEAGEVVTVLRRTQTWSHKLIEEFMLTANEAVAGYLTEAGGGMVYRIHEPPAPPAVEALAAMLAPLGLRFFERGASADNVKPRDFQRVIDRSRGTPVEAMVKTLCLRAMMQARYSDELIGHFGLAADRYCHFTSPIRRYPDLIVHRLLKNLLNSNSGTGFQPVSVAPENLSAAAGHCSERERAAMEVERQMVNYHCCRWMIKRIGEEFEGVVSGVTGWGFYVELVPVLVEGLVPIEIIDDRAEYREDEMVIYAWPSGARYRIGDRVRVRAERVDLDNRRIFLSLLA
jgi:ribonuclease R